MLQFLSFRNVEADVALRSTTAIFTYCRSRGLFAGISLEGSYLIERKDTNRKYEQPPAVSSNRLASLKCSVLHFTCDFHLICFLFNIKLMLIFMHISYINASKALNV